MKVKLLDFDNLDSYLFCGLINCDVFTITRETFDEGYFLIRVINNDFTNADHTIDYYDDDLYIVLQNLLNTTNDEIKLFAFKNPIKWSKKITKLLKKSKKCYTG